MMRRLLAVLSISAAPFGCAFAQVPGVTAKAILLGQSAAFSGPAAQLGIQMNLGTKAYFDYVNAHGGVYGRKIALKTPDGRYEANTCSKKTKKLPKTDRRYSLS